MCLTVSGLIQQMAAKLMAQDDDDEEEAESASVDHSVDEDSLMSNDDEGAAKVNGVGHGDN